METRVRNCSSEAVTFCSNQQTNGRKDKRKGLKSSSRSILTSKWLIWSVPLIKNDILKEHHQRCSAVEHGQMVQQSGWFKNEAVQCHCLDILWALWRNPELLQQTLIKCGSRIIQRQNQTFQGESAWSPRQKILPLQNRKAVWLSPLIFYCSQISGKFWHTFRRGIKKKRDFRFNHEWEAAKFSFKSL